MIIYISSFFRVFVEAPSHTGDLTSLSLDYNSNTDIWLLPVKFQDIRFPVTTKKYSLPGTVF